MNKQRRTAALAGLGGVALVVAGLFTDAGPQSQWSDARISGWYASHGVGHWLLSAYLIALGAPLLLVFAVEVRSRLAAAAVGDLVPNLALGAGIAWAVTVLTGAGLYAAVPAAMTFSNAPAPGGDASRFSLGAAYGTIVMFSALAAALLALVISVGSLHGEVVPRWLAIAGIPASVLMLANAALPMAVIVLWYTAASISMALRSRATERERRLETPRTAPALEA